MRTRFVAAGVAMGLVLAVAPAVVKADFGGICGRRACVVPPSNNRPEPEWVQDEPQQLYLAYLGNAQQAMRDGAWDSAEGWAKRALAERPDNAEALAILSQIGAARRRRDAVAANQAGLQLADSGNVAAAAQKFREALALDPGDTVIQGNLKLVNDRLAVANMRDAAAAAAESERLNHRIKVAADRRVADDKSRQGLENLAGKMSSIAWTPCEGKACAEAAIARKAGELAEDLAKDEGSKTAASEIARIPFDDNRGGITVIPPGATAPVTLAPRPAGGEAAKIRERIEALQAEEAKLTVQIAQEVDGVKRAVLIQKEGFARSKRHIEEIKYASFTARYAPDAKGGAK